MSAERAHDAMIRRAPFVLLLALTVWVSLLFASPACAQKVLLVRPAQDDRALYEAYGRLSAELELQRFEVEVLDAATAPGDSAALEAEAQARGAFAAIALERGSSGTSAEVCLVDRVTGKITLRRLAIEPSREGPTLLALRAVDLLRTSLAELPPGEPPPPDVLGVDPHPPPPEVIEFARRPERFRASVSALLSYHPDIGAGIGASLAIDYRLLPRLFVGVHLAGPLFGSSYEASTGSASVRREFFLATVRYDFSPKRAGRRWEWGPMLGLGPHHLEASGNVEPPLVSATADSWAFAITASLYARWFFAQNVALAAEAGGLAITPGPVIAVDTEQSPRLGFHALGSLGLTVAF